MAPPMTAAAALGARASFPLGSDITAGSVASLAGAVSAGVQPLLFAQHVKRVEVSDIGCVHQIECQRGAPGTELPPLFRGPGRASAFPHADIGCLSPRGDAFAPICMAGVVTRWAIIQLVALGQTFEHRLATNRPLRIRRVVDTARSTCGLP